MTKHQQEKAGEGREPETIQIAPELRETLAGDWSKPVQVKVEGDELVFRNLQAVGEERLRKRIVEKIKDYHLRAQFHQRENDPAEYRRLEQMANTLNNVLWEHDAADRSQLTDSGEAGGAGGC
jgi:hypothetical protein